MAGKADGSGTKRAVDAGEGRGALRGIRKDPQIVNFGLIVIVVITMIMALWVRSSANDRVDQMERTVSGLPRKLEPAMKEQAIEATAPEIKALTDRIDTLEIALKNLRKDVSANWDAVEKSLETKR